MSEWVRADSVDKLNSLFNTAMPPISQEKYSELVVGKRLLNTII